jgi:ApbE superfamily uncharacterized protein (UPF0280 family)
MRRIGVDFELAVNGRSERSGSPVRRYDETILPLPGGSVLVECGPMRLVISAWVGRVPQPGEALVAASKAIEFLEEVASQRERLSAPWRRLDKLGLSAIPLEMLDSVALVGDEDLTPMASVAGAIADAVATFLVARGMTKVIVDNGGDLAIRIGDPEERVRVGVRSKVDRRDLDKILVLTGRRASWGVATSGLGGRSLTRGIAWSATAIAEKGALADAAATSLANSTWVEWGGIERKRACELDPQSDLGDLEVTVRIGELPPHVASLGLRKGLEKARLLMERGVISGAMIRVGHLSESVGLEGILEG